MAKDPTSTEFIGWFYETDFEYLADPSIAQVVITGVRSEDMMLRALLAGIDPAKIGPGEGRHRGRPGGGLAARGRGVLLPCHP